MIAISIIISGFCVAIGLVASAYCFGLIIDKCVKDLDKSGLARHATMKCLIDLVDTLNEKFPGSTLRVEDLTDEVKVIGDLKYIKKDGN